MKKLLTIPLLVAAGFLFLIVADLSTAESQAPSKPAAKKEAILWTPADLKWTDVPEVKGVKQAVLWGDPKKGAHGVYIKFPAGTEVALHTHTYDSRGTVISGTVVITPEGQSPKELGPGSYYFVPGGQKHQSGCKRGADCLFLDQSTGVFDIKMVEAAASKK